MITLVKNLKAGFWIKATLLVISGFISYYCGIAPEMYLLVMGLACCTYFFITALIGKVNHPRVLLSGIGIIACMVFVGPWTARNVEPGTVDVTLHHYLKPGTNNMAFWWREEIVKVTTNTGLHYRMPWHKVVTVPLLKNYNVAVPVTVPTPDGTRVFGVMAWVSVTDPTKAYRLCSGGDIRKQIDREVGQVASTMTSSLCGPPPKPLTKSDEEPFVRHGVTSVLQTELKRRGISLDHILVGMAHPPPVNQKLVAN